MTLRIIHTADWHLGQTFYGYDRSPEQESFLDWLKDILAEKKPDVLLISGDIFDVSNPPAAAQKLFYTFLKEANRLLPRLQIVCIAGNHDSAARLESPRPLLETFHVSVIGSVPRTAENLPDYDKLILPLVGREGAVNAWCLAVPYLRPGDFPAGGEAGGGYAEGVAAVYREVMACASLKRRPGQALVATGHLHALGARTNDEDPSERPILGGLEFVPASAFGTETAYVALGHIHRPQAVAGHETIRYAGSPLPMSFSEQDYRHQLLLIETEGEKPVTVTSIEIPVSVKLLSLPPEPEPLSSVIEKLNQLPATCADPETAPFLRVRILLEGPEPSLRYLVENALRNKAVRLAKIEVSYPGNTEEERAALMAGGLLPDLRPLDVFRRRYRSLYNDEVPSGLVTLFREVLAEVTSREEPEV